MSQLALDLGVPSTMVTEAVYARGMSALKDARVRASKVLKGPTPATSGVNMHDRKAFIEAVRQALYASKICSYAQGFVQLQAAAKEHDWPLNYGDIALLWRGGCIIRAAFLERIKEAFDAQPDLENLLLASVLHRGDRQGPSRLAASRRLRHAHGPAGDRVQQRPGLLRPLPPRTAARQPAASPARLLRRPHLPAHRQAARQEIPQRVARPPPNALRNYTEPQSRKTKE